MIVLIIGSLTLGQSGIESYQSLGASWTNALDLSEERVASDIKVTCTSTAVPTWTCSFGTMEPPP